LLACRSIASNEDQSDSYIQEQMTEFVNEISEMEPIGVPPDFFWLRDFEQLASSGQLEELGIDLDDLTFNQQIDLALSVPEIDQIYGQDIVREEQSGNITASRTVLYIRDLDLTNIHDQIEMLRDQEEITDAQPINAPENQKNGELSFFTFDDMYFYWELFKVTVAELISTTVSCVVAVTVITLLFIPHWTAVLFVTPLIIVLYFMLLGTLAFSWNNDDVLIQS
jgi:Patched family